MVKTTKLNLLGFVLIVAMIPFIVSEHWLAGVLFSLFGLYFMLYNHRK